MREFSAGSGTLKRDWSGIELRYDIIEMGRSLPSNPSRKEPVVKSAVKREHVSSKEQVSAASVEPSNGPPGAPFNKNNNYYNNNNQ